MRAHDGDLELNQSAGREQRSTGDGRTDPGGLLDLQAIAGNQAVAALVQRHALRRQEDGDAHDDPAAPESPAAGQEEGSAPAGAPPVIKEDVEEGGAEPSAGADAVQTQVQRQDDGGAGGGSAAPACQQLTWSDFPAADPPGTFDAQTGFTWSQRGGRFSASFDASSSWVRPKWKTDSSAASMQLLRHEQYHLTLVCLLASKATAAVAAGTAAATVTGQMRAAVRQYEASYEADTNHGQNTASQDSWVANIDAGAIAFPAP